MTVVAITMMILVVAVVIWSVLQSTQSQKKGEAPDRSRRSGRRLLSGWRA
jgi:hypothetical protein